MGAAHGVLITIVIRFLLVSAEREVELRTVEKADREAARS